jgi:uncharacterized protein
MIKVGEFQELEILRIVEQGAYLEDGDRGLLLPNRFLPENAQVGELVKVFIYHDNESRLIATTEGPYGVVGDIVSLKVMTVTDYGAFLDNGIMKDIFVPLANMMKRMLVDNEYLVRIYIDEKTGRLTATQKIKPYLNNEELSVKELDQVELVVYRNTDLGYQVIINNKHLGLLYHNEIYTQVTEGNRVTGFIKKIFPDNKIDVVLGKPGYDNKVSEESAKILNLLTKHGGFLPYHDKSNPKEIYSFFGMSKKTFKMSVGSLYKQKRVTLEKNGIQLVGGVN